jgi:hypothetical protein
MNYIHHWDQPEHIHDFNESIFLLELEVKDLQKRLDNKRAFLSAMCSASKLEEALFSAEAVN